MPELDRNSRKDQAREAEQDSDLAAARAALRAALPGLGTPPQTERTPTGPSTYRKPRNDDDDEASRGRELTPGDLAPGTDDAGHEAKEESGQPSPNTRVTPDELERIKRIRDLAMTAFPNPPSEAIKRRPRPSELTTGSGARPYPTSHHASRDRGLGM